MLPDSSTSRSLQCHGSFYHLNLCKVRKGVIFKVLFLLFKETFYFISSGITHSAVWAAMCSFIAHNTEPDLRPSAQAFLQGMHTGFGKFCGAVFGGILIKEHGERLPHMHYESSENKVMLFRRHNFWPFFTGTVFVFRVYGITVGVFFVLFVLVNFYNRNEGGIKSELPDDIDPKTVRTPSCCCWVENCQLFPSSTNITKDYK